MTSRERDQDAHREAPPVPWHNRTSTVLGASVAAVAAIAIVVTSIGYVSRQFTEPEQAPVNYIGPAFSATESSSSPSTTTPTVVSASPPVTRDINPDLTPSSTTDSSESSTSRNPASRSPRTREEEPDDESSTRTTRNRPRTNVTRTLNPAP